jgi:pentatricopeptide repeat protein
MGAGRGEVHVYVNNTDHISGESLQLGERYALIQTRHCGQVTIDRSAIKGISGDSGHAREILGFIGEEDIVHNRNGDRLSGQVVEIKDGTVFITTFFAGDKVVEVQQKDMEYLVLASSDRAQPRTDADEVRVILANGDVVSGKVAGFEEGWFVLHPPYSEELRFNTGAFRSLHNAKLSKEFLEGGIAQGIMDVLEKSTETAGNYSRVYPALIKTFLKEGDKESALLVFERISPRVRDQYVFQVVGDDFLANDMPDAAVQAYERMLEMSPAHYYAYAKLFSAYLKMGRYAEAAGTYEQMLSNPRVRLTSSGVDIAKIRMDLVDVYIQLEEFDKAAAQLRQVVAGPTQQPETRKTALSKLIMLFKRQGNLDSLIEKYRAELAENNRTIGEGYLGMVEIYLSEGKFMKAKSYAERLDEIGLEEYAEKAGELISD